MPFPTGPVTLHVINAFAVYSTVDEYGRRGGLVGVFTHESDADNRANSSGWFGGRGEKVPVTVFIDGDKNYMAERISEIDLLDTDLPQLRRSQIEAAKAKLTPEERALLGIDD